MSLLRGAVSSLQTGWRINCRLHHLHQHRKPSQTDATPLLLRLNCPAAPAHLLAAASPPVPSICCQQLRCLHHGQHHHHHHYSHCHYCQRLPPLHHQRNNSNAFHTAAKQQHTSNNHISSTVLHQQQQQQQHLPKHHHHWQQQQQRRQRHTTQFAQSEPTKLPNMVDVVVEQNFPAANLVPKLETGVAAFLTKYPEYNGDGVTIAIFDSGVDPRSEGLQTTPDGQPKVIERYDCSGCGDVDTSRIVRASADGTVIGLSGRVLRLTDRMRSENAGDGQYRVGLKGLFDLYPAKVRERLLADTKLKDWDAAHKAAIAEVARRQEQFDVANPGAVGTLPSLERLAKENLDQSLEALNGWDKSYTALKPLYDCVLYETSDGWRAVIDTSETGDLEAGGVSLGEYSRTHEVQSIAEHLSVSVNVHEAGNLLEIVGMCSSHGTHVASIASGNHTADSALNGIAPAAKIVSLTIGDSRLGSMETGTALVRAMIKVMELCEAGRRVHVINMSYGEHAHFSTSGRLGELMCEVVNKYGVVWVASAGNHGPALCTIGTPPDIAQPIFIGVGAYVSPAMIEAEYALRHKVPANCYTWTSRDPCIDGGQGVTVCAPGAAIASVPEFTMTKQQLMHGTSMAAPHVAGAVALLISGLQKAALPYSPFSVKRALWNTATRLDTIDPFAQGNGLLNVERAFEALAAQHSDTMIRYAVTVESAAKGIHIRQANPVAREYSVAVEPIFLDAVNVAPAQKINFNVRLTLVVSEPWVKCGTFLDLSYSARLFSVTVDPTGLPPGVHTARIRAYDTAALAKGTVFEVPITVVQPHLVDLATSNVFQLAPASYRCSTITRTFLQVPAKCTWAVLRLRSPNSTQALPARFFVHTLQLAPQRYCKEYETQKLFSIAQESWTQHAFRCIENNVLEVCIAKFWSTAGEALLEASVEFRGIHTGANVANAASPVHVMHSAGGIHRVDLVAATADEAQPAVQLKTAVMVLRPNEAKITPLGVRDCVPLGRQIYQQQLQYSLHLSKAQELSLHAPLLADVLYESEFESQLWQLFDTNKLMVACGDAYSGETFVKLEKGDYVVRLQVRHEKRDLLEKVAEANMLVTYKLATPVSLDVFGSYKNAVHGSKKVNTLAISRNVVRPVFMVPLAAEKISKANVPSQCSWLNGALSLSKDEFGRKLEVNNFRYILTEGPAVKKASNGSAAAVVATGGSPPSAGAAASNSGNGVAKDAVRSKLTEYKEGLRDFKHNMLMKLDLVDAEKVYAEIVADYPDHLLVHNAMINKLDPNTDQRAQLPYTFASTMEKNPDVDALRQTQKRIIELANLVIGATDQSALLVYMGTKTDNRPDAAKVKSTMDRQRAGLIDAIVRKAVAVGKLRVIEMGTADETECLEPMRTELHELFVLVGKFADYSDVKLAPLLLWHSFHYQHHGRLIKVLQRLYDEKLQLVYLEEMQDAAAEREWPHVVALLKRMSTAANPMSYRIF